MSWITVTRAMGAHPPSYGDCSSFINGIKRFTRNEPTIRPCHPLKPCHTPIVVPLVTIRFVAYTMTSLPLPFDLNMNNREQRVLSNRLQKLYGFDSIQWGASIRRLKLLEPRNTNEWQKVYP